MNEAMKIPGTRERNRVRAMMSIILVCDTMEGIPFDQIEGAIKMGVYKKIAGQLVESLEEKKLIEAVPGQEEFYRLAREGREIKGSLGMLYSIFGFRMPIKKAIPKEKSTRLKTAARRTRAGIFAAVLDSCGEAKTAEEIGHWANRNNKAVKRDLETLSKYGMVIFLNGKWSITPEGREKLKELKPKS